MAIECTQRDFGFHPLKLLKHREIRAQFDGGAITTEGGGLLLREVEKRIGIVRQFAACFRDYRNADLIEHTVEELVAQRVYGLALGYEDLNDHEELRKDPLPAVLVEKSDPVGESTLNRVELTPATASAKARYKKIVANQAAVDRLFVEVFLAAHPQASPQIILDLDATDDPLLENQEGRFQRLLRPLLLSAAVHFLWRVPAGGGTPTHRQTDLSSRLQRRERILAYCSGAASSRIACSPRTPASSGITGLAEDEPNTLFQITFRFAFAPLRTSC